MTDNPDQLKIEYLNAEVRRLQSLVDNLARIQPRAIWADAIPSEGSIRFPRQVEYSLEIRVPDWPLLSARARLSEEFWAAPFGLEALSEVADRVHRSVLEKIRECRP